MRRLWLSPILACALLLSLPAVSDATAAAPTHPSCAEGPATSGGVTRGTPCPDVIVAPPGVIRVQGGGGDDTIVPAAIVAASPPCPIECRLGVGSQTFEGGPGDDVVYGERGNDRLLGGEGNDQLFGGIGDDVLLGGPGDDRLSGGHGADSTIDGEAGSDYVRGDGTVDKIFDSGGGNDTLSYTTGVTPGLPNNVAYPNFAGVPGFPAAGGERGVYLNLETNVGDNGVASFGGGVDKVESDFERVIGTPFADYIVGSSAGETIYGGGGGDVILGKAGPDALHGGADGDHLDGGSEANALDGGPGSDHCASPSNGTSCESGVNTGGVVMRDASKVSAGFAGDPTRAQLYLVGSAAAESVTATYVPGSPATVTFTLGAGSTGSFDQNPSGAGGCNPPGVTSVVCTTATPLDSLLIAGMAGADELEIAGFPRTVSVLITGGEGGDSLIGGETTEDVLVDGDASAAGDDTLAALDGDDALLQNEGEDERFGGAGNDLFLTSSICEGSLLDGEAGRDNSSWARFQESGVQANLGSGEAGGVGPGATPDCDGDPVDELEQIEDLEGTELADVFYGDGGRNQLLGWEGADAYFAGDGDDPILANSGDADTVIDCGLGNDDSALVDHPEFKDPVPIECESVREADKNSFRIDPQLPPPPPSQPPLPAGGNEGSASPPPSRRDTTPPRTRITRRPSKLVTASAQRRSVVFRFAASERATFRCRLDRRSPAGCVSPRAFRVGPGSHVLRVVAIDRAGNADPTPALFRFRVRLR